MRNLQVWVTCLVLFSFASLPVPALSAVFYEMTTATQLQGPGGSEEMRMRSYIDGDYGRIEFVSTQGNPLYAEGAYLLTRDGGATVYLVNPAERSYMEFDLDALFGMAGSMMNAMGGVMEMSFSDVSAEKLAEEPGGELLGYTTTHYKFRTAYTMTIRVMGFARTSKADTTTDVWCTDALGDSGFNVWLRPDRMRTGNDELDALIAGQIALPDCLPLRIDSSMTADGASGDSRTQTHVTEIREEPAFDAAVFELPADFERISLADQIPAGVEIPNGFPFGQSSSDRGDQDSDDEEGRPFGRLRGLIGR